MPTNRKGSLTHGNGTVIVQFEIAIGAPPQRVWEALVHETSRWWPSRYYLGEAPRGYFMEDWVGGRVYEDWGDGQGLLWSRVIAIRKGRLLRLVGDAAPEQLGPARTISSFVLRPQKKGTVIEFQNASIGKTDEKTLGNLEKEWAILLEDCFKPYVEEGKQPERPDSVAAAEAEGA